MSGEMLVAPNMETSGCVTEDLGFRRQVMSHFSGFSLTRSCSFFILM